VSATKIFKYSNLTDYVYYIIYLDVFTFDDGSHVVWRENEHDSNDYETVVVIWNNVFSIQLCYHEGETRER